MMTTLIRLCVCRTILVGVVAGSAASASFAQVNPGEIVNPRSRAIEQRYLAKLTSLNRSIGETKFPMSFRLARYIEATSGHAALDTNGIEFIVFRNQVVLKISGIYGAAFDSKQLGENDRAARVFEGAVVPMLRRVAANLPQSVECDGIGFEVIYETRDTNREFDFAGREVLSLVLNRDDAFAIAGANDGRRWQEILDRSDVYVSGKPVVLRLDPSEIPEREIAAVSVDKPVAPTKLLTSLPVKAIPNTDVADYPVGVAAPADPKASDAIRLQEQFGAQAKAVLDTEMDKLHPDPGTSPQFETEGDQVRLHFTIRNPLQFEASTSSIYKRAARSFDLFLAPELKSVVRKLPAIAGLNAYQFSVLNTIHDRNESSEVVDYICPVDALHSFIDNRITSQQLINQSTVLVNGIRIGIDLEIVE
jgi:hypothetical protein